MDTPEKRISDLDLARFFIEKNDPEHIITELFNFLCLDCVKRSRLDPDRFDCLVGEFEETGCCDAETLASVIRLIRETPKTVPDEDQVLLENIKTEVLENLTYDTTVKALAEKMHLSYYYICHFFKAKTGRSIQTFRLQKRMEKAVRALCETDQKITDIALACGYNNASYFTEHFVKCMGMAPSELRKNPDFFIHPFYEFDDMRLAAMMPSVRFCTPEMTELPAQIVESRCIAEPDETFSFLHEAAIIEFNGVLYASWYQCPKSELHGYTPICGKRSYDGGKTWTKPEIIADDPTEKILYCPPVYGICDGKLYMLMNRMVAPDHIHSLDLFVLNETDRFELCWSRPIPFKLNTNVVTLPDGKRMLPGRIGRLDGFPNTPAVLISDDGKIDTEWRLVKIAENGTLPDGSSLVHPELSVICDQNTLYMFSRDDQRKVPLVYLSHDFGESWSGPAAHDIPCRSSKIYTGRLQCGKAFLIANVDTADRSRLVIYFSDGERKDGRLIFEKRLTLFDRTCAEVPTAFKAHYPAACEADGKLYVIATIDEHRGRDAMLYTIDLQDI